MEHLLLPSGACLTAEDQVPYSPRFEEYDHGPFLTYPDRRDGLPFIKNDYKGKVLYKIDLSKCDDVDLVGAIFQTWIFHGLLCEVLRDEFNPDDFKKSITVSDRSISLLDTSKLVPMLKQWREQNEPISEPVHAHLYECFGVAQFALHSMSRMQACSKTLCFSLSSVVEMLSETLAWSCDKAPASQSWRSQWDSTREVGMIKRGWCPFYASQLRTSWDSLQALFFVSKLHHQNSNGKHSQCSSDECVRSRLSFEFQNGATHIQHGCRCDETHGETAVEGPEFQAMLKILRGGSVPQIRITQKNNSPKCNLKVETTSSHPYVAISHVFSDGLGNKQRNALKHCRVKDLESLLQSMKNCFAVSHDAGLWLDTLCCPMMNSAEKKMAIVNMGRTYRDAECVLVLDSGLRQLVTDKLGAAEILAQVLSSAWMRRLWTFQEAFVAARVWIQFADGPRDFSALMRQLAMEIRGNQASEAWTIGIKIEVLSKCLTLQYYAIPSIDRIRQALSNRRTTRAEDEAGCLATIWNLDVAYILGSSDEEVPGSERMRRLWDLMSTTSQGIPETVVFYEGPRLDVSGYTWAPSTFMSLATISYPMSLFESRRKGIGSPTHDGLLVSLPGVFLAAHPILYKQQEEPLIDLSTPFFVEDWPFFVQDPTGSWYKLVDWQPDASTSEQRHRVSLLAEQQHLEFAVIFHHHEVSSGTSLGLRGILVVVIKRQDDVTYVRRVRKVTCMRLTETQSRKISNLSAATDDEIQAEIAVPVSFVIMSDPFASDRIWCVD